MILGVPYDYKIDVWSFACIIAELYIGYPIFPGENEKEQMWLIMETIGLPSRRLLEIDRIPHADITTSIKCSDRFRIPAARGRSTVP